MLIFHLRVLDCLKHADGLRGFILQILHLITSCLAHCLLIYLLLISAIALTYFQLSLTHPGCQSLKSG